MKKISYSSSIPFFNTFGGNPVSCATGMAVLDVLENEQLIANVRARHQQMMQGFQELQSRYPVIGDVRVYPSQQGHVRVITR